MKTLFIAINSKYIHPAMGVFQLIANSKSECIYKEFTIKDSNDNILKYINEENYDLLAFSIYIWNVEKIKEILNFLKDNNFSKPIYCGGPEASFDYIKLLNDFNVSYITKGEGEDSFNHLIDYLNNKIDITKVENLYYKNNNQIYYTFNKVQSLDNIKHDYSLVSDFKNRICYIESSRGCYFNCSYCMASLEKPVRFFPMETVKKDLLLLLNNNARIIKFLDRSFNVNKGYMLEILKFIKENDNGVSTFQFEIVGDLLTNEECEFINTMRKGMLRFEIGIQSTNEATMKAINRKQSFNKIKENILKIKDNVVIHTDLIAGLPFEGLERFKQSFNETFLLLTEELQLGFLKELKGTQISNEANKYCYIFDENAPFEVQSNMFITKDELNEIKLVEESVDKFYNTGFFKKTFSYLFSNFNLNPFEFFKKITAYFTNYNIDLKKVQFDELTKHLYESLSFAVDDTNLDKEYLLFIIKQDYLSRVNVKPKIFWESNIDRKERNEIYNTISKEYNISIQDLYSYGRLEKYNDNYYIIIYKNKREIYYNKKS